MLVWFLLIFVLLLQGLSWLAARAVAWQLGADTAAARRQLCYGLLIFSNSLMVLPYWLYGKAGIRITAAWLALLWFLLLATAAVWLFDKLLYTLLQCRQPRLRRILRLATPALWLGLTGMAVYNAYTPTVRYASVRINKPLAQPLRIGMASDTHLGVLVGARQLDKLAEIMQRERVDLIVLPGDMMDDDTTAYYAENMRPHLQKLRAPLGVYATLGNHDLFGHEQDITRALEEAGITVLNDRAVRVHERIWVVGRPDNLDHNRLPTAQLLRQADPSEPIILLDHRPDQITAHANLPIDLQVSGHVHNGQIFPGNLLVRLLNRLHYGYEAINGRHFFVTSGFGFWGLPFRLGSQAEAWVIDVQGTR